MTTLCIRIFRFFRRHRVCYWVSLVALFALCGYFASQVHLEEDINKLMPSSKNEDGSTKLAFANLRIKDKTFLLFAGKEGTDLAQLTEACDAFIDSLNRRNDALPEERRMVGDVFYRLSEDLLPDLADYLLAHFPAYLDTAAYQGMDSLLTREHLTRQMQANRRDLTSPVGSLMPELILTDPIGLRNLLGAQLASMSGGNSTGGYKIVDGHIFVPDSTVCLAFLTPMYSATNTGQGSALFDTLNELITQFSVSHPEVRIGYHGTPASGYYNARQIKSDLTGTITGALVLVLLFIAVCFRRWDTIPLLLLPVAFGALFGLAVMYFVKGQFSLLALGIGGVILGVALSYALHVMTHYKYVGEQVLKTSINLISYNKQTVKKQVISPRQVSFQKLCHSADTHWLEINGLADADIITQIVKDFGLHNIDAKDILTPQHVAKVEMYGNRTLIILNACYYDESTELHTEHICLLVADNTIVTFKEGADDKAVMKTVLSECKKVEPDCEIEL